MSDMARNFERLNAPTIRRDRWRALPVRLCAAAFWAAAVVALAWGAV